MRYKNLIKLTVLSGLFCMILFFNFKMLKQASFMPISLVRVFGDVQYLSKNDIMNVVSFHSNKGFWLMDVAALHKQLANFPLVKYVEVEKRWPNKLYLTFVLDKPIALLNNKYIVSNNLVLFEKNKIIIQDESLSKINCELIYKDEAIDLLLSVNARLKSFSLKINELMFVENTGWNMKLNNGLVVMLGKHDLENRLQRFMKIYTAKLQRMPLLHYVDLRYVNGVAVK